MSSYRTENLERCLRYSKISKFSRWLREVTGGYNGKIRFGAGESETNALLFYTYIYQTSSAMQAVSDKSVSRLSGSEWFRGWRLGAITKRITQSSCNEAKTWEIFNSRRNSTSVRVRWFRRSFRTSPTTSTNDYHSMQNIFCFEELGCAYRA